MSIDIYCIHIKYNRCISNLDEKANKKSSLR